MIKNKTKENAFLSIEEAQDVANKMVENASKVASVLEEQRQLQLTTAGQFGALQNSRNNLIDAKKASDIAAMLRLCRVYGATTLLDVLHNSQRSTISNSGKVTYRFDANSIASNLDYSDCGYQSDPDSELSVARQFATTVIEFVRMVAGKRLRFTAKDLAAKSSVRSAMIDGYLEKHFVVKYDDEGQPYAHSTPIRAGKRLLPEVKLSKDNAAIALAMKQIEEFYQG